MFFENFLSRLKSITSDESQSNFLEKLHRPLSYGTEILVREIKLLSINFGANGGGRTHKSLDDDGA